MVTQASDLVVFLFYTHTLPFSRPVLFPADTLGKSLPSHPLPLLTPSLPISSLCVSVELIRFNMQWSKSVLSTWILLRARCVCTHNLATQSWNQIMYKFQSLEEWVHFQLVTAGLIICFSSASENIRTYNSCLKCFVKHYFSETHFVIMVKHPQGLSTLREGRIFI